MRVLTVSLFLVTSTYSIFPNHFHFPIRKSATLNGRKSEIPVHTAFFNQTFFGDPVPHDGLNVSKFFRQTYYYSEQFKQNSKSALLYISGPDDFEKDILADERNPIVKAAKKFGSTMFVLEHRYYGGSIPDIKNFNETSLKLLNTIRASRDVRNFIKYANEKFRLDPDVRWILWGTGYGGLVASSARQSFPDKVAGVIASSTPLVRLFDFWEYNDFVEQTFKRVGGSECHRRVKNGFSETQRAMLTAKGRSVISDAYQLSLRLDNQIPTDNDIQMFYLSIISPFQQIVQYNNQFNLSISNLCGILKGYEGSDMEAVYQAYFYLSTQLNGFVEPIRNSYKEYISDLGNKRITNPYSQKRFWQYQMCTELGWFYTTNNDENGLFGPVVTNSLFLNQCFDIFPESLLTASVVQNKSREFNSFFKSSNGFTGTNAVFIGGENDPWSQLMKTKSKDVSVVYYQIPSGSYAMDMFPGDSKDPSIEVAHQLMMENINIWINEPRNPRTSVEILKPWERPQWKPSYSKNEKDARKKFTKLKKNFDSEKTTSLESSESRNDRRMFFGMRPRVPIDSVSIGKGYPPVGFEVGTFRQKVDHFDNTNPSTFQQRYFVNSQWARPGGPNFLIIGGEWEDESTVVYAKGFNSVKLAKKYGATLYFLEHRFYGSSIVGDNRDFSKLTSLQMLYDLADFISSVNSRSNSSNPWITFGCSYPGALSAWIRATYPELVIGAVSSSAPMIAKTDMYEYLMVVEDVFKRYDAECANNIQKGFEEIRRLLLSTEGRDKLTKMFSVTPPLSDDMTEVTKHIFLIKIRNEFKSRVQGSTTLSNGSDVHSACKIINKADNGLNGIVGTLKAKNKSFIFNGINVDYQKFIKEMLELKSKMSLNINEEADILWFWQTCNEFGYYQSNDYGRGIFGPPVPVNYYIQKCIDVFGSNFTRKEIDRNVEFTNYMYGFGNEYRGSNVTFITGNMDPWHSLGHNVTHDSVVSYQVNGSSHCADFRAPNDLDKQVAPGILTAQELVDKSIGKWLSGGGYTNYGEPSTTTSEPKSSSLTTVLGSLMMVVFLIVM